MVTRLACATVFLFVASQATAQRQFDRDRDRDGRGPGQQLRLKAGDPLPDVSGFDARGEPFHLRDLKGHHTVLVFGCLT